MYQKKAFNRREQDYAMVLRRKLEEAEAIIQNLSPSRARSLALTKLDEALLWANVGIAEAGINQDLSQVVTLRPRRENEVGSDCDAGNLVVSGAFRSGLTNDPRPGVHLGQVALDAEKLTKLVEDNVQKEAAMSKDGASHHLAELELMARAHKDWYYAMMSYIMDDDKGVMIRPSTKEESK